MGRRNRIVRLAPSNCRATAATETVWIAETRLTGHRRSSQSKNRRVTFFCRERSQSSPVCHSGGDTWGQAMAEWLGAPRNAANARLRANAHHKILYVTPEIADFVKSGGLGDVSAALPRALTKHCD